MDDKQHIIALERELEDTRLAAVRMMLGMIDAMTGTSEEREEVARSFDEAGSGEDPVTARMARLVASTIRERATGRRA